MANLSTLIRGTTTASGYSTTIGNGSSTSFTITHNLNRSNVIVVVRDASTGYFVYPDIDYTSTNAVVLEFVDTPTTNQYTVSVTGFTS